jgi:aerobic carbon-monoxide dehydrogenase medium subunit
MKPARFRYFDPASIDEALVLISEWGEDGKLLAGGQTLMPMLNFRALTPGAIIDINSINMLSGHEYTKLGLVVGALTRQQALEDDIYLRSRQPLVAETIPFIAHRAIRNRGTVGGSLAHADPAAEWGALAITLEAELTLKKHNTADRVIAARDFFLGLLETALAPNEILAQIRLPPWPRGAGWSVVEFSRRHGDFALAGVMSMAMRDREGTCTDARISVFGVGPAPFRLNYAETDLRGQIPTPSRVETAVKAALSDISPLEDSHSSAQYRRHLATVLAERCFTEAFARASVEAGA